MSSSDYPHQGTRLVHSSQNQNIIRTSLLSQPHQNRREDAQHRAPFLASQRTSPPTPPSPAPHPTTHRSRPPQPALTRPILPSQPSTSHPNPHPRLLHIYQLCTRITTPRHTSRPDIELQHVYSTAQKAIDEAERVWEEAYREEYRRAVVPELDLDLDPDEGWWGGNNGWFEYVQVHDADGVSTWGKRLVFDGDGVIVGMGSGGRVGEGGLVVELWIHEKGVH